MGPSRKEHLAFQSLEGFMLYTMVYLSLQFSLLQLGPLSNSEATLGVSRRLAAGDGQAPSHHCLCLAPGIWILSRSACSCLFLLSLPSRFCLHPWTLLSNANRLCYPLASVCCLVFSAAIATIGNANISMFLYLGVYLLTRLLDFIVQWVRDCLQTGNHHMERREYIETKFLNWVYNL